MSYSFIGFAAWRWTLPVVGVEWSQTRRCFLLFALLCPFPLILLLLDFLVFAFITYLAPGCREKTNTQHCSLQQLYSLVGHGERIGHEIPHLCLAVFSSLVTEGQPSWTCLPPHCHFRHIYSSLDFPSPLLALSPEMKVPVSQFLEERRQLNAVKVK